MSNIYLVLLQAHKKQYFMQSILDMILTQK